MQCDCLVLFLEWSLYTIVSLAYQGDCYLLVSLLKCPQYAKRILVSYARLN